jgi:hypothetical protein
VPGVNSAPHVEVILSNMFGEIFVAGDTGCFEGLGGDLFDLIRNDVDNVGEISNWSFLSTDVVDSNLRIRNSSIVS